jgi:ADP-ribose pyrophosphatase YjhB (NUDIX family)
MSGKSGESEPRRFARFSRDRARDSGYSDIPADGLCLSSFVLLSPPGRSSEVLVGRLDPAAPWLHIGALDPARVTMNAEGWMLPSCHLMLLESPAEAARRIVSEQLGLDDLAVGAAQVRSEVYPSRRHPDLKRHWDLEFLFRAVAPPGWAPAHPAWRELRFVDPSRTPRAKFTRSHDEVLELAGFSIG